MITQMLIDWLSGLMGTLVQLLPPLPAAFGELIGKLGDGGAFVGGWIAKFSPVVPFDALGYVITVVGACFAFWLVMLGVRVITWALGR